MAKLQSRDLQVKIEAVSAATGILGSVHCLLTLVQGVRDRTPMEALLVSNFESLCTD